jgi:probable HAF family extracellular repeat protein
MTTYVDLGAGITPLAITPQGIVVGELVTAGGQRHACAWTRGGVVDLGTLGGPGSSVIGVSDAGLVAGTSTTADGSQAGFWWTPNGTMKKLEFIPSLVSAGGAVVGTRVNADKKGNKAFAWTQAGGVVDLGSLGGPWITVTAVNAAVQVVGEARTASGDSHAFSWTRTGGIVDLGTLGGTTSQALAVNTAGQVVGISKTKTTNHAFSWTKDTGMVDLGSLDDTWSCPTGVSESGLVVGVNGDIGTDTARLFAWTRSTGLMDVMSLRGVSAPALGAKGHVVGARMIAREAGHALHAFVWTQPAGLVDLGTLGGINSYAVGVTDSGVVFGTSEAADGTAHGFWWTAGRGMVDLGPVGDGQGPVAANARGEIVGTMGGRSVLWTVDTTAPVFRVPVVVNATSPKGAPVVLRATAIDDTDVKPTLTYRPASGSTFAVGATRATCTASDASGNTATLTFDVYVKGAAEQLTDLKQSVARLQLPRMTVNELVGLVGSAQTAAGAKNATLAANKLNLLVNRVKLLYGNNSIPPGVALALVNDATRIEAALGQPVSQPTFPRPVVHA